MSDSVNINTIKTNEFNKLVKVFQRHGYEIRVCGGAVRDLLLGKTPSDVDFATEASVAHIKSIVKDAGFDTTYPEGEKEHGTVTVLLGNKKKFEVTTLRTAKENVDKYNNMDKWEVDARHRDITINSMYLGLDGKLYDYLDGLNDLRQDVVRLVGDPSERIRQNYYTILRYFRFKARLSKNADSHDAETLEAIRSSAHKLKDLIGRRMWCEFKKILKSENSHLVLPAMESTGVAKYLGLPETLNMDEYRRVHAKTRRSDPGASTMVSALLSNQSQVETMHATLDLHPTDKAICDFIISNRGGTIRSPVTYLGLNGRTLKICMGELLKYA